MKEPIAVQWIDAEKQRPKGNSRIIFEDNVGMFWGIFYTIKDGIVYAEGKQSDIINWQDIHQWIPYPDNF